MRKLQTSDIFSGIRLITVIGIKDDIKKLVIDHGKEVNQAKLKTETTSDDSTTEESKKEDIAVEMGFDLIYKIIEKATSEKGEDAVYKFIAPILELSEEEIKQLDPVEFLDKVIEAADIDSWKAFFSRVASLGLKN